MENVTVQPIEKEDIPRLQFIAQTVIVSEYDIGQYLPRQGKNHI
jgi:hypothetical protein